MGVQEVRWDKGDTVEQGIIIFSMESYWESSIGNRILCTPQNNISS